MINFLNKEINLLNKVIIADQIYKNSDRRPLLLVINTIIDSCFSQFKYLNTIKKSMCFLPSFSRPTTYHNTMIINKSLFHSLPFLSSLSRAPLKSVSRLGKGDSNFEISLSSYASLNNFPSFNSINYLGLMVGVGSVSGDTKKKEENIGRLNTPTITEGVDQNLLTSLKRENNKLKEKEILHRVSGLTSLLDNDLLIGKIINIYPSPSAKARTIEYLGFKNERYCHISYSEKANTITEDEALSTKNFFKNSYSVEQLLARWGFMQQQAKSLQAGDDKYTGIFGSTIESHAPLPSGDRSKTQSDKAYLKKNENKGQDRKKGKRNNNVPIAITAQFQSGISDSSSGPANSKQQPLSTTNSYYKTFFPAHKSKAAELTPEFIDSFSGINKSLPTPLASVLSPMPILKKEFKNFIKETFEYSSDMIYKAESMKELQGEVTKEQGALYPGVSYSDKEHIVQCVLTEIKPSNYRSALEEKNLGEGQSLFQQLNLELQLPSHIFKQLNKTYSQTYIPLSVSTKNSLINKVNVVSDRSSTSAFNKKHNKIYLSSYFPVQGHNIFKIIKLNKYKKLLSKIFEKYYKRFSTHSALIQGKEESEQKPKIFKKSISKLSDREKEINDTSADISSPEGERHMNYLRPVGSIKINKRSTERVKQCCHAEEKDLNFLNIRHASRHASSVTPQNNTLKGQGFMATHKRGASLSNNFFDYLINKYYHKPVSLRHLLYRYHLTSFFPNFLASGNYQAVLYNFLKISKRKNMLDSFEYIGNKLKTNVSLLLKYFFYSIGKIFISKPVFIFQHNKIIIQLFFYFDKRFFYFHKLAGQQISRAKVLENIASASVMPVSSFNALGLVNNFKDHGSIENTHSTVHIEVSAAGTVPAILAEYKEAKPLTYSKKSSFNYKVTAGYNMIKSGIVRIKKFQLNHYTIIRFKRKNFLKNLDIKKVYFYIMLVNKKRMIKKLFSQIFFNFNSRPSTSSGYALSPLLRSINNFKGNGTQSYEYKQQDTLFSKMGGPISSQKHKKLYPNWIAKHSPFKKTGKDRIRVLLNEHTKKSAYDNPGSSPEGIYSFFLMYYGLQKKEMRVPKKKKRELKRITNIEQGYKVFDQNKYIKILKLYSNNIKNNRTLEMSVRASNISNLRNVTNYYRLGARLPTGIRGKDNVAQRDNMALRPRPENAKSPSHLELTILRRKGLWLNKNKKLMFYLKNKFNALTYVLEKFFNCSVQLELTRLKYPYSDSNIMTHVIGLHGKKRSFESLVTDFFYNAEILNPKAKANIGKVNFLPKHKSSLVSRISGIKIRLAGRYYRRKIIPRKTVLHLQEGSLARGVVNFLETSKYIGKSKRGSFCLTISVSHAF